MAEPLSSKAWVAAWLQKTDHDLATAERALNAGAPITDTAAYHCHQAAEKALKAFLAARLEPLVKTHDLMDLLTRCAAADVRFADWADRISELSAFGTVVRYPSVDADPIVSDVAHALQTARLFLALLSPGQRKSLLQERFDQLVQDDLENRVLPFDADAATQAAHSSWARCIITLFNR